MMNDIIIREFEPEDLKKIQKLYKLCYGNKFLKEGGKCPSLTDLSWKFLKSPFESKIFIAEDKNNKEILGVRPIVIKKIIIDNKFFKGAHFMDVMVHPDYRHRGIFTRLMKESMNFIDKNVTLCYSFPNRNSYPAYKKVTNWQRLSYFEPLVYFNFRNVFEKLYLKKPMYSDFNFINFKTENVGELQIENISKFDDKMDKFIKKALTKHKIYFSKDSDYLNWRYLERPDIEYIIWSVRINGHLSGFTSFCFRKINGFNIGLILNLTFLDNKEEIIKVLLQTVAAKLFELGAKFVLYMNYQNQFYKNILTKSGFLPVPQFPIIRKYPVLIKLNGDIGYLKRLIYDPENWHFSLADNDAV